MRRKDREITDFDEIISIMKKCDVCRLALNGGDCPYIIPLNFGFSADSGKLTLYFHGAEEGTKHMLIKKDNRAAFEMDCGHQLIPAIGENNCNCAMNYESVVGNGVIEYVCKAEKEWALTILMKHYHNQQEYRFNKAMLEKTSVFKLEVQTVTAKRRG